MLSVVLAKPITVPRWGSVLFRLLLISGYVIAVVRSYLVLSSEFSFSRALFASFTLLGIVVMSISLMHVRCIRRSLRDLFVTGVHLGLPLFFMPSVASHASSLWSMPIAGCLLMCGGLLSAAGLISLWESFGILPGLRRLKTQGVYRLVRHPIYAGYLLSALGVAFLLPSVRAGVVALALVPVTLWRIRIEEVVLLRKSKYRQYARKTPWRLIPGMY